MIIMTVECANTSDKTFSDLAPINYTTALEYGTFRSIRSNAARPYRQVLIVAPQHPVAGLAHIERTALSPAPSRSTYQTMGSTRP